VELADAADQAMLRRDVADPPRLARSLAPGFDPRPA